jgi:RHS repeat-associated protein
MGESFQPLLSVGQARLVQPLALQPGRGVQPRLALAYTSGSGNSIVGLGWSLGVPAISRQTNEGAPRYESDSLDRFVFNGGEELVPVAATNGSGLPPDEIWPDFVQASGFDWTYFRVRNEGAFQRFFLRSDEQQWVVQNTDGTLMYFGLVVGDRDSVQALVDFVEDGRQYVYRWNLSLTVDRSGNRVQYRYFRDEGRSYLDAVYWNSPLTGVASDESYQHAVSFEYEPRPDSSFSYASGFRIGTSFRLVGVHLASVPWGHTAGSEREHVRSYSLTYDSDSYLSLLTAAQLHGRGCRDDQGPGCSVAEGGSLPPVQFGYTEVEAGQPIDGFGLINDEPVAVAVSPRAPLGKNVSEFFDANLDGLPDLLLADYSRYVGPRHRLYFNRLGLDGTIDFGRPHKIPCGISSQTGECETIAHLLRLDHWSVHALDINGDAEIELLKLVDRDRRYSYYSLENREIDGEEKLVWQEHGPLARESSRLNLSASWRDIAPVDANNDKLVDMVVNTGDEVDTYLNLGRCPGGEGLFGTPIHDEWGRCVGFDEEPTSSCPLRTNAGLVSFSDVGFRVADMNGDGFPDLVQLLSAGLGYEVWYWPGRGNGFWGIGARDCHQTAQRAIIMDGTPGTYGEVRGSHLGDINGDGTADLVVVRSNGRNATAVQVWLNQNGLSWTESVYTTISGIGTDNEVVRLADLNGSGTRDVVVGPYRKYHYIDFMGGHPARLLEVIDNGLGGMTGLEYRPSTHFMLADAERGEPWSTTMPQAVTVLARQEVTDGQGSSYVTEYAYRDPYYDSMSGVFRGFSQALARSLGDASTPTAVSHSRFHLGQRPDWLCDDEEITDQGCALLDNPQESLKGHPYLAEIRNDPAPGGESWWGPPSSHYLQSVHTSYQVDQLFEGLDGRGVWYAWSPQQDSYAYGSQGTRTDEVLTLPSVDIRQRTPQDEPDGSLVSASEQNIAVRGPASEVAHLRTRRSQDRLGRTHWESKDGLVGRAGDEQVSRLVWAHNPSAWIHRPCESWIEGSAGDVDQRLAYSQTFYEGQETALCSVGDRGLPTFVQSQLVTRQADGAAMTPQWIPQGVTTYDAQGLPVESFGGVAPGDEADALRFSSQSYDEQYGAYLVREQVQANLPGQTPTFLTSTASWDVGLGVPTAVTDSNGQTAYARYDRLGRQQAVYRPLCQEPSVVYQYVLNQEGGLHYVHSQTNEICDAPGAPDPEDGLTSSFMELGTSTGVTEVYAFSDGLGRARASIVEGDGVDGSAWILQGVVDFDARGNARRAYHPAPLASTAEPWTAVSLVDPGTPYEESGYDAFGRALWTTAADGTVVAQAVHGPNWIHQWDGNDLDDSSPHAGTYDTIVHDGLGRAVLSLSRLATDEGLRLQAAATAFDVLGNIQAVTRGEVTGEPLSLVAPGVSFAQGRSTTRALLYDSLGRKTHNLDPDSGTTLYYYNRFGDVTRTVDARGVQNRYLHDLAGRLVAEDYYGDGPVWSAADALTGHSSDDDADLARLADLVNQAWSYSYDTGNDFLPEAGADVLYGFDAPYDGASGLCRVDIPRAQSFVSGRASWVRDSSGCAWSSYDARGRAVWSARQLDPGEAVFLADSSYEGPEGPDDQDRLRVSWYPDGTSVQYQFSSRGNLAGVFGAATDTGSLFAGRVFASGFEYDEYGQLASVVVGDPRGSQVHRGVSYDARRRIVGITSTLQDLSGHQRTLINNTYDFDQVNNIVLIDDHRTPAETAGWAPEPVDYAYRYDSLYRLIGATPTYASGVRPTGDSERPGEQSWQHDALGSMTNWTAVEEVAGQHFYDWSLGTLVNGQQLIQAGGSDTMSDRCAAHPEAASRHSGPAPHALYFAYQPKEPAGTFEALEACYDVAGNMVALYRLLLDGCDAVPLNLGESQWTCTEQTVQWELTLSWDSLGRLAQVEKSALDGGDDTVIRNIYDAAGGRAVRLDHSTTEGVEQATLYVSAGYEIRGASIEVDGTYFGGEETKFVFAGDQRLARVVERLADGVEEWSSAPGRGYVFHTITNHLGSASVTIDAQATDVDAAVVVAQTQLPYGAEESLVMAEPFGGWTPDYGFTGKEQDPDVGLMYFGARFYSAGLGRWISADPLAVHEMGADLNQYRHVRANPLILVDPTGLNDADYFRIGRIPQSDPYPDDDPGAHYPVYADFDANNNPTGPAVFFVHYQTSDGSPAGVDHDGNSVPLGTGNISNIKFKSDEMVPTSPGGGGAPSPAGGGGDSRGSPQGVPSGPSAFAFGAMHGFGRASGVTDGAAFERAQSFYGPGSLGSYAFNTGADLGRATYYGLKAISDYGTVAGLTSVVSSASRGVVSHVVRNATRGFSRRRFIAGNNTFQLDRAGMRHILERHHPRFWNGTSKMNQSFFKPSMSVDDIADIASSIVRQNRSLLARRGTNGLYQVRGRVDGVEYVLGINNGRIGQLYPR